MRSPERSDNTKEIVMTEPTSPALEIALAYFHAWTGHDLDKAMEYIADDVVCDAPAGRLEGAAAYRDHGAVRSDPEKLGAPCCLW